MLDYFDIDWPNILKLDEKNVNLATNNFLDTINSVLNKYAPLKKVNKYKLRFKNKPWINSGIQKSIKRIHHQRLFFTNSIKHTGTFLLH